MTLLRQVTDPSDTTADHPTPSFDVSLTPTIPSSSTPSSVASRPPNARPQEPAATRMLLRQLTDPVEASEYPTPLFDVSTTPTVQPASTWSSKPLIPAPSPTQRPQSSPKTRTSVQQAPLGPALMRQVTDPDDEYNSQDLEPSPTATTPLSSLLTPTVPPATLPRPSPYTLVMARQVTDPFEGVVNSNASPLVPNAPPAPLPPYLPSSSSSPPVRGPQLARQLSEPTEDEPLSVSSTSPFPMPLSQLPAAPPPAPQLSGAPHSSHPSHAHPSLSHHGAHAPHRHFPAAESVSVLSPIVEASGAGSVGASVLVGLGSSGAGGGGLWAAGGGEKTAPKASPATRGSARGGRGLFGAPVAIPAQFRKE
jgi:hypothetical protein